MKIKIWMIIGAGLVAIVLAVSVAIAKAASPPQQVRSSIIFSMDEVG
jgi:hypothetical protein